MSHSNKDVIHAWAQNFDGQGKVQSRKSSNGNCWFEGARLYSYSTCIACHTRDKRGNPVTLITSRSYSVTTTSKHMPRFHDLPSGTYGIRVWDVTAFGPDGHKRNFEHMKAEIEKEISRLSRARTYTNDAPLKAMIETANEYRARFGLRLKPVSIPENFEEHMAKVKAKNAANAEKARKRAGKAAEERAKKEAEHLAEWLEGKRGYLNFRTASPMFRVVELETGDIVESSHGARVPFDVAVKLSRMAKRCADTGTAYPPADGKARDVTRVGDFRLDSIGADGTVTVGCHTFTLAEIERAASVAGVDLS